MATIQGIYVALFGRPADKAGLDYFNSVTKNGADLSAIGDLAATPEYQGRFDTQNNVQIITSIYQSLFGRDPEANGLEFFVGQLSSGNLTIKNIAIAILDGAQGNDLTTVNNKIATANLFTNSLDTAVKVATYTGDAAAAVGRNLLKEVTETVKTQAEVNTAIGSLVTAGNTGNTIALTANADVLSTTVGTSTNGGTVSNLNATATDRNDTINATTTGQWAPQSDKIDAGFGTDTLNATINGLTADTAATTGTTPTPATTGTGTVVVDGLNNVEIINLTAITAASTVNVANAKQLTQVWNVAGADATAEAALAVSGLVLGTAAVGVRGAVNGATTFTFANNSGTADTVDLKLEAVGVPAAGSTAAAASGVTINGIETVNVSNTGTSNVALTVENAKAVNVTGAGDLTLNTAGTQIVETFNASAFTGKLTANLAGQTAIKAVFGGTGADSITVDTVQSNDLTVNTGAGNDTLTVANGTGVVAKSVVLTGGEGNDLFSIASLQNVAVSSTTTNADFIKTLVTISDFNAAADVISIDTGNVAATFNNQTLGNIAGASDLLAATRVVTSAMAEANANNGTATDATSARFIYQGDAYVYTDNGAAGLNDGDGLVKITGISSLASFTAANSEFV